MHNEINYKQGEMTVLKMGENNNKWNSWERTNLQNIQEAHESQYQKSKQPKQKVGEGPEEKCLQRRCTDS